jgi:hypothetical protein
VEAASVISWRPLGELLVERGLLTSRELDDALAYQADSGQLLGAILVERKLVTGAVLTAFLAEQAGVELEMEPGFGSGLLAKLAAPPDGGRPSVAAPQPASVETARDARPEEAQARSAYPEDPAFELIRMRSELELAHTRIAELEKELAARPARRTPKRATAAS